MNSSPHSPSPDADSHDSWRPADKAAEAAIENPAEFEPRPATESTQGPVLDEDERLLETPGDPAPEKVER